MLLLPARCGVAMAQDTYARKEQAPSENKKSLPRKRKRRVAGSCEIRLAHMLYDIRSK